MKNELMRPPLVALIGKGWCGWRSETEPDTSNDCESIRRMKTPIEMIRLAVLSAVLVGCDTGRTFEWKQEAPLVDGRMIVVDRYSEQGPHSKSLNVRMETGQELAFTHPDTGERIRWRIMGGLQPYMLDFDQKVPYYVLIAYTVADYNRWDCPNPPYLIYRYEHGEWNRTPFEKLPRQFVKPNLMAMAKSYEKYIDHGYVNAQSLERYFNHKDKQHNIISREKISPIGLGCHESTLIRLNRQSEIDNRR